MLTLGVTTEITNADGAGPIDLLTSAARVAKAGLSVNVGAYIGFNSVWSEVVGLSDRRPTAEEIERMRALIVDAMKAGAWGVSAGLEYRPAYFARTEEVIQVVSAAAPWRTNFPNHVRITPESGFSGRVGLDETLRIAKAARLIGVITHMKAQAKEQGTAARQLASVAASTREGYYAAADVYPYLSGQTRLGNLIIPAWVQDGGRQAMLERFADPAQRPRIVREIEQMIAGRLGDVAGIYLPQTRRHLTDVMREMQVSAGEAVVRLVEKDNPSMIAPFGRESDLQKILHTRHLDRVRLRRHERDGHPSAVLRLLPASPGQVRARREDPHLAGCGAENDGASGSDDRHDRSRLPRAWYGSRRVGIRSTDGRRSRDLREAGGSFRGHSACLRQRRPCAA